MKQPIVPELIRPVRMRYVHKCGTTNVLPSTFALNVAKEPRRYATMFCHQCKTYAPLSEFKWADDGSVLGT